MEIYLIVPSDLEKTPALYEQCKQIFSRQNEKVSLHSSFNERCINVAREIAITIGVNFSVDSSLDDENEIEAFYKKHSWPNEFIQILVLPTETARAIAKKYDPGSSYDAIPMNAIVRIKDLIEGSNEEDNKSVLG